MAFVPGERVTGFEHGSDEIFTAADRDATGQCSIESTIVKTGIYSLEMVGGSGSRTAWVRWAWSGSYLDVGLWVYPTPISSGGTRIEAVLDDGTVVEIRRTWPDYTWDLYVDDSLIESGSLATDNDTWQHVQARFFIDNSGTVQTKIDGVDDIDYSGDTQPGASAEIAYFRLTQRGSTGTNLDSYVDDVVYGSGGWPGDVRFDGIFPDGDSSTEWTPSAGSINYDMIDEVPPSDADYVSAGSPELRDTYTLGDWSGTGKSSQFLVQWVRDRKDEAEPRGLEMIIDSGGSEASSGSFSPFTSYMYHSEVYTEDPSSGSVWTEDAINALLYGLLTY